MTHIRTEIKRLLRPLIPAAWPLVDTRRNIDTISKLTVQMKQGEITKAPTAPEGVFAVEYVLTLISPKQDLTQAEYQLDDAVLTLLAALDQNPALTIGTATPVSVDGQHVGYDITITATTSKE